MAGIYVHIPFCASRCVYCGFYSTTLLSLASRYIDAVVREYGMRRSYLGGEKVGTVYVGGGTPSVLGPRELGKLFRALPGCRDGVEETTVECNPDDVTRELAGHMKSLGVNRVSLGVQTFSDPLLRFARRRHTSRDAVRAVDVLRRAGMDNISIDLMFGFPGQSLGDWDGDIDRALALGVEHISAYCLTYESGTPLEAMLSEGKIRETDEETSRAMYYRLADRLEEAGYEHYEISNFCLPGFRSRHNSGYWNAVPYLGLGAAAHSYDLKSRQWNVSDVELYICGVEKGKVPSTREDLSPDEIYNDMITTALRTSDGIDILKDFYGRDYLLRSARKFLDSGLMETRDGRLRLARGALFVSDMVLSELVMA